MNKEANNKRDIKDPIAQDILNTIRTFQRKAEDAWFEVELSQLKLQDYLNNKPLRTHLEYVNAVNDVKTDRLIDAERIEEEFKKQEGIERAWSELNKYVVGSRCNEKTGYQKCKKCDKDVVDLRKNPQALDAIKIYQEHEKEFHE